MICSNQMPSETEQIIEGGMGTQKSLRLTDGFEPSHPPLAHPGRFMRLLCPVVGILTGVMNDVRHQLSMSDSITPELVCIDLRRFTAMTSQ